MEKLISMTDFVLQYADKFNYNTEDLDDYTNVIYYAKFLKQPLALGMFVPCDEDGNVLTEPTMENLKYWNIGVDHAFNQRQYSTDMEIFEDAQERVLFKGFAEDAARHHIRQQRNIEYLSKFNSIRLTDTARKQIFE